MTQTFRLQRLTLPLPNPELDPPGRYIAVVEDKSTGETRTLINEYEDVAIPAPNIICAFIASALSPDEYDDPTCV